MHGRDNSCLGSESREQMRLAIFIPKKNLVSETFIRAHVDQLPFETVPYYGSNLVIVTGQGRPIGRIGAWLCAVANLFGVGYDHAGRVVRLLVPRWSDYFVERNLATHLKDAGIDRVLAEYGTTGTFLFRACEKAGVPLFVHFHGYDASVRSVLKAHRGAYQEMFKKAAGIIAVSVSMKNALVHLGADPGRVLVSPCGVDPRVFCGGTPEYSPPHFIAVGRLVEKKAPHLTIRAFGEVSREIDDATLTIVGDGPLMRSCRQLIRAMRLQHSIRLVGSRSSIEVRKFMRNSRAFVQHSVVANNGDSEGTPVSVVEAQMTGLPVVATQHAGIADVVVSGETGYLVTEGDFASMGTYMLELARNPKLAATMGRAARLRAEKNFTLEKHLTSLAATIRMDAPVT